MEIERDPKLHSIWSMLKKRNPVYTYGTQFIASCFIYIYIYLYIYRGIYLHIYIYYNIHTYIFDFLTETITYKGIPTPRILVKDHKKADLEGKFRHVCWCQSPILLKHFLKSAIKEYGIYLTERGWIIQNEG